MKDLFLELFFWVSVILGGLFSLIGLGLVVAHELTKERDDEGGQS